MNEQSSLGEIGSLESINGDARYSDFTLKWATMSWEVEQAHRLRHRVFCDEQGLFEDHDRDSIDKHAITIVAIGNQGGWHQDVVGTVRISQEGENLWLGSRLAVDSAFRRECQIGTGLIKLAVSSAHALGCTRFMATVQDKNERLFKRLNWTTEEYRTIFGCRHAVMEANLASYPPFYSPEKGVVLKSRRAPQYADVWPGLLHCPLSPNVPKCEGALVYGVTL